MKEGGRISLAADFTVMDIWRFSFSYLEVQVEGWILREIPGGPQRSGVWPKAAVMQQMCCARVSASFATAASRQAGAVHTKKKMFAAYGTRACKSAVRCVCSVLASFSACPLSYSLQEVD
ncbi:hypothetical protein NPIL_99411 [Nephila pilipes]|uniref:Uncharacterized protein n=1 Tax=Nephila pilipes TaxID=299642 RepID=A0A8X6QQ19_NEPPI|nr:hypothetical protein NPIL_99411 [Nephila pilipes]